MDIEPLKSYLHNKENVKESLSKFLDKNILLKINNTIYIERDFIINDKLYLIKKNTLELEYSGTITSIGNSRIDLKLSQYRNVSIDPKNYYIFKKNHKKTRREIMNELLEGMDRVIVFDNGVIKNDKKL